MSCGVHSNMMENKILGFQAIMMPEDFNIFQPLNDPRAGTDIVNTTFS